MTTRVTNASSQVISRIGIVRLVAPFILLFTTALCLCAQGCAVLAGGAAGAATGYIAGSEAKK